jgi:site-specific DNA-methyltransferase (adenine-specific)
MNIPARFAIAMTDELQFILRNELIWHKPSCMPSSAKDRFTVDFEKIFFFSKETKYKFNQQIETAITPADTKGAKGSESRHGEAKVNSRPPEYHIYNGLRNRRCVWDVHEQLFRLRDDLTTDQKVRVMQRLFGEGAGRS